DRDDPRAPETRSVRPRFDDRPRLIERSGRVLPRDRQPVPGREVSVVELEAIAAVNNLLARGTRPGFAVPAAGGRGHRAGAQGHAEVFDRFGKAAADDVPVDLVLTVIPGSGVGDPLDRVGHLVGVHAGDVLAIRIADVHPDRVGAFLHAEVAGRARGAMRG